MKDYRSYSLWLDTYPGDLAPRPCLPGSTDVDVAVVGAGYTGLWSAYYLKKAEPKLRVCVIEKEIAGFGGSGRNGGWCSSFFAASHDNIAARYGRDAAIAMQQAMYDVVDVVGRAVAEEGIECDYRKGGALIIAENPVELQRVRDDVRYEHDWGFGEDDNVFLGAEAARGRINAATCLGGSYTPHCARLDPARLARGLADVVEKLGVPIYEQTAALSVTPGHVETTHGTVRAETIVRAVEPWTVTLPGYERDVIPVYSLMIATEPLPKAFWDEVGWAGDEVFSGGRHLVIYAMRTQDDRIAFGGRGAPYHMNSRLSDEFDRDPKVFAMHHRTLKKLFPALGDARITHQWGGPLGIPRDWMSSVGYDRPSGIAWAGGYVGDGVSNTNLAGRTIADLVVGNDTDITHLPWVNHRSRKWEPEPLRWLGVNLLTWSYAYADKRESRRGRPSKVADIAGKILAR